MSISSKIVVILGPTSSGKSELAVKIAKNFNGEVISADSRQVYKGLDIGSGKITKREMQGVPHHLLDVTSPKKIFTAANFQNSAQRAIQKILALGKTPIICGGTGFYIEVLISNYQLPKVRPNHKLRKELEKLSLAELFLKLKQLDPERAEKIDKKNKVRIIRAIEVATHLGKVPKLEKSPKYKILKIGLKHSKEELRKRINKRLAKRLKQGLIKEVQNLRRQGVSWKRLENLGLEYRYVALYLQGKMSKEEMVDKLKIEIWRYAKRQMTWFRKDKDIKWLNNTKEAYTLVRNFLKN